MKILIAEDEKICQNAVKNFCKKMEIECDTADNGKEAVDLCKQEIPYDVILMDMYMPELNGTQATESIRSLSHGSSYIIILLTGLEDMNEEDAKKIGFDGFIKKPLSKKAFEEIVAKYKK